MVEQESPPHPGGAHISVAKKILIGMLAVFTVIVIASAGYEFGNHLAKAKTPQADAGDPESP
jgi:hypothetical protein